MIDVVSSATRSRMMAGISGKNTKPELTVRKGLHSLGFRYSLHASNLAGKLDLFLKKHNVCIFVHGCFWHAHDCKLFKMPQSRTEFWKSKFEQNTVRDKCNLNELLTAGYRVAVVWECSLKNKSPEEISQVVERLGSWIRDLSSAQLLELYDASN